MTPDDLAGKGTCALLNENDPELLAVELARREVRPMRQLFRDLAEAPGSVPQSSI